MVKVVDRATMTSHTGFERAKMKLNVGTWQYLTPPNLQPIKNGQRGGAWVELKWALLVKNSHIQQTEFNITIHLEWRKKKGWMKKSLVPKLLKLHYIH